jgi:hypothetical protein
MGEALDQYVHVLGANQQAGRSKTGAERSKMVHGDKHTEHFMRVHGDIYACTETFNLQV